MLYSYTRNKTQRPHIYRDRRQSVFLPLQSQPLPRIFAIPTPISGVSGPSRPYDGEFAVQHTVTPNLFTPPSNFLSLFRL